MIKILVSFIVSLLMFFCIALITNTTEYKDFKNIFFASSNDKYKIYKYNFNYNTNISLKYSTNISFEAANYLIKIGAIGYTSRLKHYNIEADGSTYIQGEKNFDEWIRENSLDKNKI